MNGARDGAAQYEIRARALIEMRRFDEALDLVGRGLSEDPSSGPLHCLGAQALMALGRNSEAQKRAEAAIVASPDDEWAHRLRALALRNRASGRRTANSTRILEAAAESAQRAVTLAPSSAAGFIVLANVEAARQNTTGADEASRHAVDLAPGSADAWVARSVAALACGDWPAAEASARAALEREPDNFAAHNNLGVAMARLGRNRQAAGAFTAAGRIDPQQQAVQDNLSQWGRLIVMLGAFIALAPLGLVHSTYGLYMPASILVGFLAIRVPRVHRWATRFGIAFGESTFPFRNVALVFSGIVLLAVFLVRPVTGLWVVGFCAPFAIGVAAYWRYDRRKQARNQRNTESLLEPLRPAKDVRSVLLIGMALMLLFVVVPQWVRLVYEPARNVVPVALVFTLVEAAIIVALVRQRRIVRRRNRGHPGTATE